MKYCYEQDPEASIFFLGDAIDRGTDGYAIMKELLNNPRVIYLKGNHEDIFTKAAREIKEMFNFADRPREDVRKVLNACRRFDYKYEAIQISLCNGGMNTLLDWIMDGMPMDLVERVENLPLTFSYEDKDFCHSAGAYTTFKEVADAEYKGKKADEYCINSLMWTRTGLSLGWAPNRIAIFGHTPVPYLEDFIDGFKWKNGDEVVPYIYTRKDVFAPNMTGKKLDMDTGAVFLGRAYVLNVLTMKAQGFKDKDIKNDEIRKHDVEKIEVIQF